MTADQHWREQRACGPPHHPDMWVTGDTRSLTPANQHALTICRHCPVRQPCLDTAVTTRAVGVIQGGVRMPKSLQSWTDTSRQPRRIRKLLQQASHTP